MNRHTRTKILVQSSPSLAEQLADEITVAYSVIEMIAPRQGLTMVKMRETAKKSLFYIGEALMTEAMVEIEATSALACLLEWKKCGLGIWRSSMQLPSKPPRNKGMGKSPKRGRTAIEGKASKRTSSVNGNESIVRNNGCLKRS
ncbi:phosphonate C-P lyase system protein PhnG [Bacillus sp. JCM 19041]|uniref:phosphonate C-P lyase system protein PhnG n=1 Tax=Bacillus sp. JCM 19041 TaxID=1460637 RepID=UPI000AB94FCD